jgi:hypothetical protein
MKLGMRFNRLSVRSVVVMGLGTLLALGCSRPLDIQPEPSQNHGYARHAVLAALPPTGGLSTASLQLQVTTYSCTSNQVLDAFQVKNTGTSAVRLSDIGIRFWAHDTTSKAMVAGVNYGGCVFGAQGCYHQVSGTSASAAAIPSPCGPDASHLASWEIVVFTTDTAMLNPGETWSGLQTTAHLLDYGTFSPGTSTWYSSCLASNGQYVTDSHYAVYYQGALVYAAGVNAPSCRGPSGSQPLTGYLTPEIASRPLVGRVPGSTPIDLAISLPVRNAAGLKQLVQNVSDPRNPATYRQYITPQQFTATYGPLAGDYAQLQQWATSKGLTILKSHSNNMLLDVRGTAATIEKALYVNLNHRLRADGTQFYAPDREPSIDVAPTVLRVSQLDNLNIPKPLLDQSNGALLGPADFRGAYLKCLQNLDGAGQSIGLLSYSAFYQSDVEDYQTASGIPASQFTTVTTVPINGFSTVPDSTSQVIEPTLDVDMALSMAPRAHIYVFESKVDVSSNTLLNAMATSDPLILNLGSSWGMYNDAATQQILDQMAAQGQSFFLASGDSGAYAGDSSPGWSLNMDNITIVGGTSPALGRYADGTYFLAGASGWHGSGGGALSGSIPFYQPTVATTNYNPSVFYPESSLPLSHRMIPDVSAFASGLEIYLSGTKIRTGGTSSATPLWAGFMALVNQQNAANSLPPVGFANPALYHIGTSANYQTAFTDLQEGTRNPGRSGASYATVQGYDLVTGWGSPSCGLIKTLSTPCVASQTDPNNCGACWRSCQGGACVAGVCHPVALTTGGFSVEELGYQELAISRGKAVAATTRQSSQGMTYAEIQAVNLDGTNQVTYEGLQGTWSSGGVVVDPYEDIAYWSVGGTVHEFDLTTGTDRTRGVPGDRLSDGPGLYAIVKGENTLNWYNMSFDPPQIRTIVQGSSSPAGMTVRGKTTTEAKILIASSENAQSDPASGSILLSVGWSGTNTVLASNQDFPTDIDADADYVYWTNRGYATGTFSVNRVPIAGGTPSVLATSSTSGISTSIAVDGTSVYYTDNDTRALMKMAKDGTGKTVLVPNVYQYALHGLAVDSTSIYWLDDNAVIWKMAKP